MDITVLFRACVELAKKQHSDVGKILGDQLDSTGGKNGTITGKTSSSAAAAKSKLFPGKKNEYYAQSKDLLTTLSGLQKYLLENRSAYLNVGSHNVGFSKTSLFSPRPATNPSIVTEMTNAERDLVDQDVQQIIQDCQKRIFEFSKVIETVKAEQKQPQLFMHLENVVASLVTYMKEICTYYSEMRAIRVKRTVDFQAISKLSNTLAKSSGSTESLSSSTSGKEKFPRAQTQPEARPGSSRQNQNQNQVDVEYRMSAAAAAYFEDDEELSPEELQILEAENKQLYNELNTLSEEVDQIQTNVVQIAQLQSIFTEKVLQQDKDLEKITNLVIGTTENIKGGNEQIRQAIQQSADFRAWVLFFIIVMSLSLLFLDWYND